MSKLPACTRCGTRVPARVLRKRPDGRPEWLCEFCDDDDHARSYGAEPEPEPDAHPFDDKGRHNDRTR